MKLALATVFMFFSLFTSFVNAASLKPGTSQFIAAVVQTEDGLEIWLNPRQHWLEGGGLADSYSEEEWEVAERIVDAANLCNVMESTYEPCTQGRSVAEVAADLEAAGVEIDPEFQAWAQAEVGE